MNVHQRVIRIFGLIVLILMPTACAASRSSEVWGGPNQETAAHAMAVGLCEDYPVESRSIAQAQRDLETCRAAGVGVLRISMSWLEMEPRRGDFDFSFWDEFVSLAVDRFHMRLVPYVCYTPDWASSQAGADFWHAPPRDVGDFGRFMSAVAARYRQRIHSWELWNEPDNPAYWTGTPGQFAALVKAGSAAVRAADPGAAVVLGGIAGRLDFDAQLFRDFQISPAVDVVNMHAYYETWNASAIESLPEYVQSMHDIIAQYGDGQRLWLAEVGYSDYRSAASGKISDQYAARYAFEHTPAFQADALLRLATLAASTDMVDLFAWYRIHDLPENQRVIGDQNNRHLGILDRAGRRKPAFGALVQAGALFDRPYRCLDGQVYAARPLNSLAQVHCFSVGGDTDVLAWEAVSVPGRGVRPAAGDQRLPAGERVWVGPPMVFGGEGSAAGAVGLNLVPESTVLKQVDLTGARRR